MTYSEGHNCTFLSGWLQNSPTSLSSSGMAGRIGWASTDKAASWRLRKLSPTQAKYYPKYRMVPPACTQTGLLLLALDPASSFAAFSFTSLFLSMQTGSFIKNHTHFSNTRKQEDESGNGGSCLQREKTRHVWWKRLREKRRISPSECPHKTTTPILSAGDQADTLLHALHNPFL